MDNRLLTDYSKCRERKSRPTDRPTAASFQVGDEQKDHHSTDGRKQKKDEDPFVNVLPVLLSVRFVSMFISECCGCGSVGATAKIILFFLLLISKS